MLSVYAWLSTQSILQRTTGKSCPDSGRPVTTIEIEGSCVLVDQTGRPGVLGHVSVSSRQFDYRTGIDDTAQGYQDPDTFGEFGHFVLGCCLDGVCTLGSAHFGKSMAVFA